MKILTIHADFIEFEAKKKAFAAAEEGIKEGKQRVNDCLVIFTAVEKRDESNVAGIVQRYIQEIKNIAQQVNARTLVLYPYAHLSSQLSNPKIAEQVMKEAEQLLKEKFTVARAPFGWYKAFTIACKGHPLSELSREFTADESANESAKLENSIVARKVDPSEKKDAHANATYLKLIDFLDKNNAEYKLLDHPAEGRTDIVSPMRGNALSQAAKCIIIMVKTKKDEKKFVLGVVPGDAKINLNVVKDLFHGTYVSFATPDIAEKLAGSVSGTILPFSFNSELELIVDPALLKNEELYFNAARLDRSMVLKTKDYERLTKPRIERIAEYVEVQTSNLKREYKDELFVLDSKKLTPEEKVNLSGAILVAKAVKDLFPQAKIASSNFYHDQAYVDIQGIKLKQDDLSKIEKQVEKISALKIMFKSTTASTISEELQKNILQDLGKNAPSYTFDNIQIVPLFKDAFVSSSDAIRALKIMNLGSAYWKNNEKNQQLTRIYSVAFDSKEKLQAYLQLREDAENRSHLKIGKEQGLFVVSELVGAGMPLLAPKGTIIRNEILKFLWDLHKDKGYKQVWTPHLAKEQLYKTSGHWDKFGDELFHVQGKEEKFLMKPMNCPHHMQIYNNFSWSYRDLPVRFFEPATIYRDEKSGQLLGLSRVRAITQDDGHLFCRVSQIGAEVRTIVNAIHQFYRTLKMDTDYWVRLSVRGADRSKYLGSDEVWNQAEAALELAAKELKLPYKRIEGEAAFYGPKLDFMFKDALGREWQLSTIQCDFNLPERFDLSYINEQGKKERPVVIHRAISGSLERFMSVLIEHFAGKFPLWLSPVQVKIVTVTDRNIPFAQELFQKLQSEDIRVELDDAAETIGRKVRNAQMEKVNYIVTIGDKEIEQGTLAVRSRDGNVTFGVAVDPFIVELKEKIKKKVIE